MKSVKEITDIVIDFALENMYSEIEEWDEEDGHHVEVNLSPMPSLYEKLNALFSEMYVEIMIDMLKNYYNQQGLKIPGR